MTSIFELQIIKIISQNINNEKQDNIDLKEFIKYCEENQRLRIENLSLTEQLLDYKKMKQSYDEMIIQIKKYEQEIDIHNKFKESMKRIGIKVNNFYNQFNK